MKCKSNLSLAGACYLFVNGLIFVFYGVSVPGFIRGVHWLITLAAVLFMVALPAIYRSLGRVHKSAARLVTAAFGAGMVLIVTSDVLFVSSLLSRLAHELFYAFEKALFVICLPLVC